MVDAFRAQARDHGVECFVFTSSIAVYGRAEVPIAEDAPRVPDDPYGIGKLAVFAGVRDFPVRVKCATLAWHCLKAALEEGQGDVSTE